MWASAKVDERSASVNSAAFALNEVIDIMHLILAVAEHLLQVLFGHF